MSGFALAIEYVTGYAVATDHADREAAEWPPHPARVFMALAAAHFETDGTAEEKQSERAALAWLAELGAPALALPPQALPARAATRTAVTVYVPVNDVVEGDGFAVRRLRQPRMFPRTYVGTDPIRLIYTGTDSAGDHLIALERICRQVTRIGHSSSLVWARLEHAIDPQSITHQPSAESWDLRLRTATAGAMERLEAAFNGENVAAHALLEERAGTANKRTKAKLNKERVQRFPFGVPAARRPVFPTTSGYRIVSRSCSELRHSPFDPNLIVLKEAEENDERFGLESTLALTIALRGLILGHFGDHSAPDWVSGHVGRNGPKLSDGRGHMALAPLASVGREDVDVHVAGMAVILPRGLRPREVAAVFGPILFDGRTHAPALLTLRMGRAGEFRMRQETSDWQKRDLEMQTWTGPHVRWRSVTPVVLDRMPKRALWKDRHAWINEVIAILRQSCCNQNLPDPIDVRIEKSPLWAGSLPAMPGQGGFPLIRPGTFQIHVDITFDQPVVGPLLLGAGRFRGYGLCRPFGGLDF